MPVPPAPPPLEHLGQLPFSFDPSIGNAGPNEWRCIGYSWSEVLVVNRITGREIAVPRRWLGPISSLDDTGVLVELLKPLEFRRGAVCPVGRRLIVMPSVTAPEATVTGGLRPAPVMPIRLHHDGGSRLRRIVLVVVAVGMAGWILFVSLCRGGILGAHTGMPGSAQEARQF